MTYLVLTDFLDVVSKSGSPKATKVSQLKHRPPYSPATDFYKTLREGLQSVHKTGKPKAALGSILTTTVDPKKHGNYQSVLSGYRKWWGKKTFLWFEPPNSNYLKSGVEIAVNPELGLEFNSQRHAIKLYLKEDPLTKLRIDLITGLMHHTLGPLGASGTIMSVLDARRSRLISSPAPGGTAVMPMVDAELAYIAALWPLV